MILPYTIQQFSNAVAGGIHSCLSLLWEFLSSLTILSERWLNSKMGIFSGQRLHIKVLQIKIAERVLAATHNPMTVPTTGPSALGLVLDVHPGKQREGENLCGSISKYIESLWKLMENVNDKKAMQGFQFFLSTEIAYLLISLSMNSSKYPHILLYL